MTEDRPVSVPSGLSSQERALFAALFKSPLGTLFYHDQPPASRVLVARGHAVFDAEKSYLSITEDGRRAFQAVLAEERQER